MASEEVPEYIQKLYNVRGKVGEGTYGVVYLASPKENQRKLLAIKTFKPGKEGDGISVTAIREIALLRELKHANIVKLEAVHVSRKESSLSLAFAYAETDLYEMVKEHRERDRAGNSDPGFHPYTLKSLIWQLLRGIDMMHQSWTFHRDLKPSNILVVGQGPETGSLKIADFGLARIFHAPLRPLSSNGVVVTIWYRAPELLLGAQHYTPAIDIWAIGCIFGELMTLKPLFQGEERKQPPNAFQAHQIDKMAALMGSPSLKDWPELACLQHWRDNTEDVCAKLSRNTVGTSHLSHYIQNSTKTKGITSDSSAVDLLRQMLVYNPGKRITAAEALEHPYFKQAPLPGENAFVHLSSRVAGYARRPWLSPGNHSAIPDGTYKDPNAPGGQGPRNPPLSREPTPIRGISPAPNRPALGVKKNVPIAKRRRTDLGPGFR